jgi:hypothetical protein
MTDAPESQGPSTEAQLRPRRGRAVIGLVGVFALAGAGVATLAWRADVDARERESVAWGTFTRCLIGDAAPVGGKPSLLARKIQLRAVGEQVENRAASDGDPWPSRCSSPALAVQETLKDTGRLTSDGAELGKAMEAFGKKLKESKQPSLDISETIDRLWDLAGKLSLTPKSVGDVKPPPAPVDALDLDALEAVPPLAKKAFSLDTVFSERVPSGLLRLIATSKDLPDAPLVCEFPAGATTGHCGKLPAPVLAASKDLRLLGSTEDDAHPLVFADKRGDGGIFRSDTGEKLTSIFSYGGFSRKDGFAAVLGWDEKGDKKKPFVLTRQRAGAPAKEDRFMLEGVKWALNDVAMLWDHMVWEHFDGKTGERRLLARKLAESDDPTAHPTDVGKIWDYDRVEDYDRAEETIRGCKTREALVVLVNGRFRDSVAFFTGDRWIEPLQLPGTGGTLSCRGTEATETRVDPLRGDASWKEYIGQDRCTPAGCQHKAVNVGEVLHKLGELVPADARNFAAADLDGKLLVVWVAGAAGGVRMKLAPIDQIVAAPDTVVLDDMTRGGHVEHARQLNDIRLFTQQGYAVLLVGTSAGVHALRIDPGGKVSPIPIK